MTQQNPSHKLYCYIDETGQDTKGQFFLVSIVITGPERDTVIAELEHIEQASKKGLIKWHKASFDRKLEYLNAVLSNPSFKGRIFFSHYSQTTSYVELTVYSTAKAILERAKDDYKATVVVDGLRRNEVAHFARELRKLHIRVKKVRGVRDESNALIRLADAIAGFVRDALEGKPYAQKPYQEAKDKGILKEV